MRAELLKLLREAWDHGGCDALEYSDGLSTRSSARMDDASSDLLWKEWEHAHAIHIERILEMVPVDLVRRTEYLERQVEALKALFDKTLPRIEGGTLQHGWPL